MSAIRCDRLARDIRPLPMQERSGSDLRMHRAVLGLDLRLDAGQLRFHDPATVEPLRSYAEAEAELARQAAEQARQDAEARAAEESRQRRTLEARLAELEQRLRG